MMLGRRTLLLARKMRSAADLYRRKGWTEVADLARIRGAALFEAHRRVPGDPTRRARMLAATLNRFSGVSALAIGPAEARQVRDAILIPYLRRRFAEAVAAAEAGAAPLTPVEVAVMADARLALWDFRAIAAALPDWRAAVAGTAFARRIAQVACRAALRLGRLADAASGLENGAADLGALLLRGDVCDALGRMEDAGAAYRDALRRHGYDAYARQAYGLHLLKAGRILDGLAEWSAADALFGTYPLRRRRPQWFGEPLGGRRLMIMFEHGLGDMIQTARFLPRLRSREPGASLVGRVPSPLLRLFRRSFPAIPFVAEDGPEPEHDLFVPSMHLAAVLDAADLEPKSRYLDLGTPVPRPPTGRPRIGVCWRGAPRQYELTRSVPLDTFAVLFDDAGLDIVVLLNRLTDEEAASLADRPNVAVPPIGDFADLAALIASCDLVVSVDTAVVHLAGAGGAPALLLSRPDSCWRWGAMGPSSPWYDTVEVLRHDGDMDWPALLARAAARMRTRFDVRATV